MCKKIVSLLLSALLIVPPVMGVEENATKQEKNNTSQSISSKVVGVLDAAKNKAMKHKKLSCLITVILIVSIVLVHDFIHGGKVRKTHKNLGHDKETGKDDFKPLVPSDHNT